MEHGQLGMRQMMNKMKMWRTETVNLVHQRMILKSNLRTQRRVSQAMKNKEMILINLRVSKS